MTGWSKPKLNSLGYWHSNKSFGKYVKGESYPSEVDVSVPSSRSHLVYVASFGMRPDWLPPIHAEGNITGKTMQEAMKRGQVLVDKFWKYYQNALKAGR